MIYWGQGFVSIMDGSAHSKPTFRGGGDGELDQAGTLFVSSLEKGFRVLEAFREAPGDLGLTEIALRTGLDKSAAQRFTNTLYQLGYLEKDPRSRRYRPAARLMEHADARGELTDQHRHRAPRAGACNCHQLV